MNFIDKVKNEIEIACYDCLEWFYFNHKKSIDVCKKCRSGLQCQGLHNFIIIKGIMDVLTTN